MSPRTEEQFKKIREDKRKQILDAALTLFAEKGYHASSVAAIAKKAGISKGLIYNYFDSKVNLLNAIVEESAKDILQFFDPNKDGVLSQEEFFYFIENLFESIRENIRHWQFYVGTLMQPQVAELIEHDAGGKAQEVSMMIADLFRRSGCDDPEGEMLILVMILKGAIMTYVASPEVFPLEQVKDKINKLYKSKFSNLKK